MTDRPTSTSPSTAADGDDARALYDELTDDLLYDLPIGRATMMGYPGVRVAGKFLASYDDKVGALVLKLPRQRVTQLVENAGRRPFRAGREGVSGVGRHHHRGSGPLARVARRGRWLCPGIAAASLSIELL